MPSRPTRIAAILPMEMEYSARLLEGGIDYVREHPQVVLVDLPYPVAAPQDLVLRQPYPFDAALVWATCEAAWVEDLLSAGMPVVSASSDWPPERVPCVSFDTTAAVGAAVNHLARLQPKSMAYLVFQLTGNPVAESRSRLFRKMAARHGITVTIAGLFAPTRRKAPKAASGCHSSPGRGNGWPGS